MMKNERTRNALCGVTLLLAGTPAFAFLDDIFFPLTDYCWEVTEPGVPDTSTLNLRFKFMGNGNYLVSGAVLEVGASFPIHGNAITDGSTIRMTTLVSGFEMDGGSLFTSNGVATVEIDAATLDGDLKGIQIGTIDDGTTITPIQAPFAANLTYLGKGPTCG